MRTLDEVIETAPYVGTEWTRDALHYLKEYREEIDNIRTFHDDHIAMKNELAEIKNADNDYLTWEELKQMEGKPVWVESHGDITQHTGWAIVKDIRPDRVNFILSRYEDDGFYALEIGVLKKSMGAEWQAYRKERHENI